jgi:hypothetical protein
MFLFFITNPHIIVRIIWVGIIFLALMKYFRVRGSKKVSWQMLCGIAIAIHFLYAALLTWSQYFVWSHTEVTKVLTTIPLPEVVPMFFFLEWLHPLFEASRGYFMFYAFNHFFLSTFLLMFVVGGIALLLFLLKKVLPTSFRKNDTLLVLFCCIAAGWPNIFVVIPLAFFFLVGEVVVRNFYMNEKHAYLPGAFLTALVVVFFFGTTLLQYLNLYTLVAL